MPHLNSLNLSRVSDQSLVSLRLEGMDRLLYSFLSGRKPTTLRSYRADMEDFREFLHAEDLNQACALFLLKGAANANSLAFDYRNFLLDDKSLQPSTINRRLSTLRSLTKLARMRGLINWNLEVANLKVQPYRDTRGPGRSGFVMMLDEVEKRTDPKGIRDKSILHLLHDLALRRSEVVSLDIEDVDLESRIVHVMGKGNSQKEILTMPRPTNDAVAEWVKVRGDSPGALFVNFHRSEKISGTRLSSTSLYRMVRDLGKKTNQTVRPHGLRHTSISEAVVRAQAVGMDVTRVLHFSRHKDLKTLQVYIDSVDNYQGKIADLVAG